MGPARRKTLLRHFGSVKRIREAEVEAVAAVAGIGPKLAAEIHAALNHEGARNPAP